MNKKVSTYILELPGKIWLFVFGRTPLRDFPVSWLRYTFSGPPGIVLSRFLFKVLPSSYKSRRYDAAFTRKDKHLLDVVIYSVLDWQYHSLNEDERRKFQREHAWGGEAGKKFHDSTRELSLDKYKSTKSFLRFRRPLIWQISELLSSDPNYHTICEIGTGNGRFLECLSREFPNIKRFVGIDLNRQQIEDNKEAYRDSGLEFVYAEITDWVSNQCKEGTIFVTVDVLEYFAQEELQKILELIYEKISHSAIAMSEPINLDLSRQVISKPRDGLAYSYNYPYLVKQHGYKIFRQELQPVNPDIPFYNRVTITATSKIN